MVLFSTLEVSFNILLLKRPIEANGKKIASRTLLPTSGECKKNILLLEISSLKKKDKKKLPKEIRPKKERFLR